MYYIHIYVYTCLCMLPGCWSILHEVSDGPATPAGWSPLCYITTDDIQHVNTPCTALLQDLPGVGDDSDLLAQGGNFGCWRTNLHPEDDTGIATACRNNYQHNVYLNDTSCPSCIGLVSCIRYPQPRHIG